MRWNLSIISLYTPFIKFMKFIVKHDFAFVKSICTRQKAYGTGCSQAVPHPSTIPARRCLTSVIRRERVCSSWYGRRHRKSSFSAIYNNNNNNNCGAVVSLPLKLKVRIKMRFLCAQELRARRRQPATEIESTHKDALPLRTWITGPPPSACHWNKLESFAYWKFS